MNQPENQTFSCGECQAGHLRRAYVTYFTWLGDELITVPDFPAWVCDVCGRREYDPHALSQLNLLLNPNAGRPRQRNRKFTPTTPSKKGSRPSRP
jgi:YgiT-type zinc finger domain-containing protein